MNKKDAEDFFNFYLELPPTDYLKDIEIQDEYEKVADNFKGLSDEQVSQIARDSLQAAKRQQKHSAQTSDHHKKSRP